MDYLNYLMDKIETDSYLYGSKILEPCRFVHGHLFGRKIRKLGHFSSIPLEKNAKKTMLAVIVLFTIYLPCLMLGTLSKCFQELRQKVFSDFSCTENTQTGKDAKNKRSIEGNTEILQKTVLEKTEHHRSLIQPNQNQSLVARYDQLCSEARTALSMGQNECFNQKLLQAEQVLRVMKFNTKTNDQKQQVTVMEKCFDELYQKIPNGQSLFFQKDKEKLQALYTKPSGETYSSLHGQFYEPTVTTHELIVFFNDFREKWGYIATSVNFKTDYYYTQKPQTMMTAITFRKNSSKINDSNNEELTQLNCLLRNLRELWCFDNFEIGYVNQAFGYLKIDGLQDFGSYILLFHKRVHQNGLCCKKWK